MKCIITLLVMAASLAFAETNSGYQVQIDEFFAFLEKGKASEAMQSIYKTNLRNDSSDQKGTMKERLNKFIDEAGDFCGKAHVTETKMSDHFIHIVYLALYEKEPVMLEFYFYRPKDQWMSYSFSVNLNLELYTDTITRERYYYSLMNSSD